MACNTYQGNDPDKLADMLCRLMAYLESNQDWPTRFDETGFPADILLWWEKHKEWDEKRNNK